MTPPTIVSPPVWYCLFWVCVFLPAFALMTCVLGSGFLVALYFVVKWAIIAATKGPG